MEEELEQTQKEEQQLTKKELREIKRQKKEENREKRAQSQKTQTYIKKSLIILVIFLGVIGFWKLSQNSTPSMSSSEILQVQNNDWTKGSVDSKVVLIEYLDFECEACGAYYPLVKRLSEEYDNEVLFVVRYFPLSGHKNGLNSALAVESAGKQGKYWEMQDILFQKQRYWGEQSKSNIEIFDEYAEKIGLDMEQYKKDIKSQEVRDRVIEDRELGRRLGVNSTPSFFLNGEKIKNPRGYEAFKTLIDEALKK